MKFGSLFLVLGVAVAALSIQQGGWFLGLLWFAGDCLLISVAYFSNSPKMSGKRTDGTVQMVSRIVLLPYLTYVGAMWHWLRLTQNEAAYDVVNEQLLIGRRLIAKELPPDISNIVDLTCEFAEPPRIVNRVRYLSFPILDASAPAMDQLHQIATQLDQLKGKTLIHCAQGHGRTGTVAAALLLLQDSRLTVDRALQRLRDVRPALRCNQQQVDALHRLLEAIERIDDFQEV